MAVQQLHLFPAARPLAERFGAEFFRSVPESPGVYFFCGADAGVLYVGKARNLRRRLGSYRSALPERLPRKLRRLLASVSRIHWDECRDEATAIERERELLLTLKPKFNTVGTYPSPKVFIGWQQTDRGLLLGCGEERLTLIPSGGVEPPDPLTRPPGTLSPSGGEGWGEGVGRFKGAASWTQWFGPVSGGRFLHGAILRLLWWTLHPTLGWESIPKTLPPIQAPRVWEFARDPAEAEEISRRLDEFFAGTSPELVEWFVVSAAWRPHFERAWIGRDALLLLEYFERLTSDVGPDLH
jgi:hypothetical protein